MTRVLLKILVWVLVWMGWIAPAAAEPRILVVSRDEKAVKSYHPQTYQLQFKVEVPGDPHEVVATPDGRFAFTTDFEGRNNTVSIIDLESGTRADGVKMDPYYKPHGLAMSKSGAKLYVTCEASRVIVEFDVAERKIARTFKLFVEGAHTLALSPDERLLFVPSQWDNNVSVVAVEEGKIVKTIATGKGAESAVVTPDGKEAWVVNRVWQTLAIIDIATLKKVQTMTCEFNPMRIVVTPDSKVVIVTSALSDEVAFVDRAKREIVGRVKTGDFPVGMAMTRDGSRLYVTNMNQGDVTVVDLVKREVVHRFPVGGQPEGITLVE